MIDWVFVNFKAAWVAKDNNKSPHRRFWYTKASPKHSQQKIRKAFQTKPPDYL
jgi:hypothetical protein